MNGWIEFHTLIPRGPKPPHQHLLLGWSFLSSGRGCRSWPRLSSWLQQSDSHPSFPQSVNDNKDVPQNTFVTLRMNLKSHTTSGLDQLLHQKPKQMFFVPLLAVFDVVFKVWIDNHQNKTDDLSVLSLMAARQEQKSYTYHSFLPDDAHAILNTRKPVGDLCEIILAHGSLFDGEWTVVGPHNIQSVTAAKQRERWKSHLLLQRWKKPETLTSYYIKCEIL